MEGDKSIELFERIDRKMIRVRIRSIVTGLYNIVSLSFGLLLLITRYWLRDRKL